MIELLLYLSQLLRLLSSLWWLWLAIFLYFPAKALWLYAIREIKFYLPVKWVLLQIIPPEEIPQTPKGMENLFSTIWALYDPPANIREYWIRGTWLHFYSLEIVGGGEKAHFYMRVPATHRDLVEAAIYSQYPSAMIKEVPDYIFKFGKRVPNKNYDLWGADMDLIKPEIYPLRTYPFWETELTREEKRLDPLAALFEIVANLKEDEEIWFQIRISPVTDDEHPYLNDSQKEINKIMRREEKKVPGVLERLELSKIPFDILSIFAWGAPGVSKEELREELELGIMRLTPGEAEVLRAVEENLGKYVYESNIRFLYIAKREIFSVPRGVAGAAGALAQFSTINLNGLKPGKSKTKVMPWFFEKRRLFMRKRKLFRYYIERKWPWHRKPYIMSTAELATLYHFPGRAVAPSIAISRVEVKPGGPPITLPR